MAVYDGLTRPPAGRRAETASRFAVALGYQLSSGVQQVIKLCVPRPI